MREIRRSWPGWDGWLFLGLGLTCLAVYMGRGRVAGLWHVSMVLAFDVIWLGATWWTRR